MLDLLQGGQVLLVVRLHGNRPADMLQGRHLIAHALIGQSAEIVPPGIPVGAIVQSIDGLLITAIADILACGALVVIPLRPRLPGLIVPASAKGIVAAEGVIAPLLAAALVLIGGAGILLRIFDPVVGLIFRAASASPGFRSGWYFFARRRYACFTSSSEAPGSRPSTL